MDHPLDSNRASNCLVNVHSLCFSLHLAATVPGLPLYSVEDEGGEDLDSPDVGGASVVSPGNSSLLSPLAGSGPHLLQQK